MSELKRYMVPGGHGIEAHKAGLLYRKADADEVIDALRAQLAELQAQVQTARDALEWYAEQGADCRKIGARGDVARAKLDRDGGHKARVTIAAMIQPTEPRPDAAK